MRRLRLEHHLSLLVSLLLAVVLGAAGWLAYREMRNAAFSSTVDRMDAVALQVAQLARTTLAQRAQLLARVAADPAAAAIASGALEPAESAARAALAPLGAAADDGIVAAVVGADGVKQVRIGTGYPELPPPSFAEIAASNAEIRMSDFVTHADGETYYWISVPVTAEPAGGAYLTQLRRLAGQPQVFEELVGTRAAVFLAQRRTGWVELGGRLQPPHAGLPADGVAVEYERAGVRRIALSRELEGTGVRLVVEQPRSVVYGSAHEFAWRFSVFGLLLLAIGVAAATLLSRRLVKPISELSAAARAIATGSYEQRVRVERDDEVGRLADAFNTMAGEIHRTIADAQHSQATALQANRAKSAFLATMSHEIRTPINAIVGYAELLDLGVPGPLTTEQHQYLARIRASTEHLMGLVEDVLDMAKIEAGELRMDIAPSPAEQALRAAITVVLPQARLRGITLDRDADHVLYYGDERRVQQILVNLLSNAIKFTESGGRVAVRAYARRGSGSDDPELCCFEVADTGAGIPADMHAHVFEPFVQLETGYTRRSGGAGLGLAISQHLARLMDGEITLRSEPGVGSTFTLRLPAATHAPEPVPAEG